MLAPALVEPVDLLLAQEEDAAQHQLGDALGVRLRVGERERAAPRAAEDLPALDAEVRAERLDVGDQMPGGVVDEATRRACSGRSRAGRRARCGRPRDRRSGAASARCRRPARRGGRPRACPSGCRTPRSRARGPPRRASVPPGRARSRDRGSDGWLPCRLLYGFLRPALREWVPERPVPSGVRCG